METARLLRERLGLDERKLMLTFQSRFGRAEWLQPYTDKTVEALAQRGVKNLAVVTPGFAADCLETLEEIAVENGDIFRPTAATNFALIPCLNDSEAGMKLLAHLVRARAAGLGITAGKPAENGRVPASQRLVNHKSLTLVNHGRMVRPSAGFRRPSAEGRASAGAMLCATEAGSAARSFKGCDCCARRARRGAGNRCVGTDLCTKPIRAGADRSDSAQRFTKPPDGTTRATQPVAAPAAGSGAGDTGFDSTGSIAKQRKRKTKPGSPYPVPRAGAVVLPPPLARQTAAPQIAARATYANVYKPPDAPVRRPLPPNTDPYEPVGVRICNKRTSLAAIVTYKFSRELWLKGEFRQEWMRSSAPGVDYDASIFLIGLKAQH